MNRQEKPARSERPSLKSTLLKLRELMRESGLNEGELVRRYLVPLLSATEIIPIRYKGEVTAVVEVPDNSARLEALKICFELLGAYSSNDPNPPEPDFVTITVSSEEEREKLENELARLNRPKYDSGPNPQLT